MTGKIVNDTDKIQILANNKWDLSKKWDYLELDFRSQLHIAYTDVPGYSKSWLRKNYFDMFSDYIMSDYIFKENQ